MAKKFKRLRDGQWSQFVKRKPRKGYVHLLKCCGCGLVHLVQHQVTRKGMRFRAWRKRRG